MMISDRLRPESEHTIEWDKYTEGIGEHEHVFGLDIEVFLNIPEAKRGGDGACSLSET